jgi:hypothetical protein
VSHLAHQNRDGSIASGWGRGAPGFWNKLLFRPDGCWDWTGYLDKDGAGKFYDGKRSHRAPRYAWEQLIGPIAPGQVLLAIVCWNRKCVNPAHREPVPKADVVRWINATGRPIDRPDNRGEMCGGAKLEADAVHEMRAIYRAAKSKYGILRRLHRIYGQRYGVSYIAITSAVYGRSWRHLGGRRGAA